MEEVRGYCQGKVAHFKIPQHIRFVDSFPMTITGKVLSPTHPNVPSLIHCHRAPDSSSIRKRATQFAGFRKKFAFAGGGDSFACRWGSRSGCPTLDQCREWLPEFRNSA
jgi:hypothetical protein